jgi:putative transcriptional regulator
MAQESTDAETFQSYAGRLLLAMPDMFDPNFDHAVILMCVHDSGGAMGIDIGTVMDGVSLHGLMDNFGIDGSGVPDMAVVRGGPVEPRRGFILHSLDWEGEHVLPLGGGLGLSGSMDILRDIAAGKGPKHYLPALGYAGWASGQLEAELTRPGWFVGKGTREFLFETPIAERWNRACALYGIDPAHLAAQSGRA